MRIYTKMNEMDNVIRISARKRISQYFEAVVMRVQPAIYNKYGCVKVRFTKDLKKDVYYLSQLFWHLGLAPSNLSKLKNGLKVDKDVILGEAYELELKKIGATRFEDNEEFRKWFEYNWNSL